MASLFRDLAGKALTPLLALGGVTLGLWLYFAPSLAIAFAVFVALVLGVAVRAAWVQMPVQPRRARWLIESWMIMGVLAGAAATVVTTWLILHLDLSAWLASHGVTPDNAKDITGLVKGAVLAVVNMVLVTQVSGSDGVLSTGRLFRSAIEAAGKTLDPKPPSDTAAFEALYEPNFVRGFGPTGWDFKSRGVRAQVLGDYLQGPAPSGD